MKRSKAVRVTLFRERQELKIELYKQKIRAIMKKKSNNEINNHARGAKAEKVIDLTL